MFNRVPTYTRKTRGIGRTRHSVMLIKLFERKKRQQAEMIMLCPSAPAVNNLNSRPGTESREFHETVVRKCTVHRFSEDSECTSCVGVNVIFRDVFHETQQ